MAEQNDMTKEQPDPKDEFPKSPDSSVDRSHQDKYRDPNRTDQGDTGSGSGSGSGSTGGGSSETPKSGNRSDL